MFDVVEVEGKTYAVSFRRPIEADLAAVPEGRLGTYAQDVKQCGFWTRCFIRTVISRDHMPLFAVWDSVINCHNRNMGRKIALRKALHVAGFDKPTRTKFWEAYFQKRNGKKT